MNNLIIIKKEEFKQILQENNNEQYEKIKELIEHLKSPKKDNYTVKEVAQILNVTELTTRNYIKKGLFKANKIGRRVIIDRIELEKSLSEVKSLKYRR